MRGTAALFFVLFLDCGQSVALHPRHVAKGSPQKKTSEDTEFASSANKQEEKLGKILDDILRQVVTKVQYNPTLNEIRSTTARPTAEIIMKSSYPMSNISENIKFSSNSKLQELFRKLFDEILWQELSKLPYNPAFDEIRSTTAKLITEKVTKSSPTQKKYLKHTEFASKFKEQEKNLNEIFDEILQQVLSRVPYNPAFDEIRRMAAKSKNFMNPSYPHADALQNIEFASSSVKPAEPKAKILDEILRHRFSKVTYYPTFQGTRSTAAESITNNVMNPNYPQPKPLENTEFASSSIKSKESMAEMFDKILRQRISKVINNPTFHEIRSTVATSNTNNVMNPSYVQPETLQSTEYTSSSIKPEDSMAKIFDEILRQKVSEVTNNKKFYEMRSTSTKSTTNNVMNPSYAQPKTFQNTEDASSSFKPEDSMAKIFYEILRERASKVTYNATFPEMRSAAAMSTTSNVMNPNEILQSVSSKVPYNPKFDEATRSAAKSTTKNIMKPSYPQQKAMKYTEFASNLKNLEKNLTKILDEILGHASAKVPYNPKFDEAKSSAVKATTKNIMKPSYPQQKAVRYTEFASNLKNQQDDSSKIFDEFLGHATSKVSYNPKFEETTSSAAKSTSKKIMKPSYLQPKTLKKTQFARSSIKPAEAMARVFNEILQQGFSKVPYNPVFDETARTTANSSKKNIMKEEARSDEHSPKSEFHLRNLDTVPINAEPLSDEKKVKEAYSSDKKVKGRIAALDKEEEHLGAASSEEQKETLPCTQTLHFLQRNIIIASVSVAGILMVTVALLLLLANCGRCKWAREPPANMTYNIFIMNGKTWWQKFQEHVKPRKSAEKQEQLRCDSYI